MRSMPMESRDVVEVHVARRRERLAHVDVAVAARLPVAASASVAGMRPDAAAEARLVDVTTPASSAAIANSGFTVEPGGYTPRIARSYIGRFGSSVNAMYSARESPRANRFGSNAGC